MEMKGLEIRMQIIMLHCGAVALWGRAFYSHIAAKAEEDARGLVGEES